MRYPQYKPQPWRSLNEIRADTLILERESGGWFGSMVAEPRARYQVGKLRIYVDTSVFGGCEDDEYREPSRRLFDRFRSGSSILLLSDLTRRELKQAPEAVRGWIHRVPEKHIENVGDSGLEEKLATAYIESGAVPPSSEADARHIALATLSGADYVVSWNFKHMVNLFRIQAYNGVNLRLGYEKIEIITPQAIEIGTPQARGDSDE